MGLGDNVSKANSGFTSVENNIPPVERAAGNNYGPIALGPENNKPFVPDVTLPGLAGTQKVAAKNEVTDSAIEDAIDSIVSWAKFQIWYIDLQCFRIAVNRIYKKILEEKASNADEDSSFLATVTGNTFPVSTDVKRSDLLNISKNFNINEIHIEPASIVHADKFEEAQVQLANCLRKNQASLKQGNPGATLTNAEVDPRVNIKPFDRRMDRLYVNSKGEIRDRIPFDSAAQEASTIGFIMSDQTLQERNTEVNDRARGINESQKKQKEAMRQDDYYIGIPSLINTYSITKLYGSKGGEFLIDQKNSRAWYEIDQTQQDVDGFSKNPNTTSLISWGNGDPYGRTPYHFTDFAFCKYWNIIPNNRMITLRRYAAPIYDNMKFPGMDGVAGMANPALSSDKDTVIVSNNGKLEEQPVSATSDSTATEDFGSGKRVDFPPMATAVTYFGEETGNKISELLKFTTGLNWAEAEANLWEVSPEENPDIEAGAGGLFGGLTKFAKTFNIAMGTYDNQAVLNQGMMPPDPYKDGPYENRIIGPVNRISSVKKREAGLQFENNLSITFEYSARPIGGVNPKAALLDILSNFLVIGSASAVFWGGQHRFMGQPQKYPFIGGDKGIQQWYRGDPIGWGATTMQGAAKSAPGFLEAGGDFFKKILGVFSAGSISGGLDKAKSILTGEGVAGNLIKNYAAEKSSGQIPYLTGMRALLIGEPVGDWHVTIGNPLNPIAMIGNLILDHIEIEFNDELGPDDFPTELKVIVVLEHGMARDRDAIQSIFNRGMGRIYELADDFTGSADFETAVDKQTQDNAKYSTTGRNPSWYNVPIGDSRTNYGKWGRAAQKPNAMGGEVSVWKKSGYVNSVSGTQNLDLSLGKIDHKSQYRAGDWIQLKALK